MIFHRLFSKSFIHITILAKFHTMLKFILSIIININDLKRQLFFPQKVPHKLSLHETNL